MFQETLLFYTLQVWDDLRKWRCCIARVQIIAVLLILAFSNLGIAHVGLELDTSSLVYHHFPTDH